MKIKFLLISILCIALCACQSNNDIEKPDEDIAEYTIMVYGCGGGGLDIDLMGNLSRALKHGSTDKVKMTWQFNMSKAYQGSQLSGTVRFVLPSDTTKIKYYTIEEAIQQVAKAIKTERVSEKPIPLYKPENIAAYIDWAASVCPAKNYIFVVWDHGLNWTVKNEATKSALFDDNFDGNPAMSLNEFIEGVKLSSVKHFAALYNDNCLSCQMEYYTAYSEIADFAIGSANPASSLGGRYDVLLQLLNGVYQDPADQGLSSALKLYCESVGYFWQGGSCQDISVFDLRKLPKMNELLKQMVDYIVKDYPVRKEKYDEAVKSCKVYYKQGSKIFPDIDLYSLLNDIHLSIGEMDTVTYETTSAISKYLNPYNTLCDEAQYVCGNIYMKTKTITVHYGVNYMIGDEYRSAASLYEQTAFHKATGWGNILSLFEQPLSDENNILTKQ